jgi:maltose O-acetyltransferase
VRASHSGSRAWNFYVNQLAASPVIGPGRRAAIYRRCGIELAGPWIFPRVYVHSANLRLGRGVLINDGVMIENVERVEIGARTAIGMRAMILTSTHELGPHDARAGAWMVAPVTIGAGCWIGAGAVVLPGVTIGDGCVVAARSLVREDCEPDGLYGGVPARRLRDLPVD